jgi:hypothetical protein
MATTCADTHEARNQLGGGESKLYPDQGTLLFLVADLSKNREYQQLSADTQSGDPQATR